MITVGIISDTHLSSSSVQFSRQCTTAFSGCDTIIHAGDLIDISLLAVFRGKEVHAVCGNSCNSLTRMSLPKEKVVFINGFQIAITHGTGPHHNIEDRVFVKYPDADCIIFGHTHLPVCHEYGKTLMINPGSFKSTGIYGSPGSYAILQIGREGLQAKIYFLPELI